MFYCQRVHVVQFYKRNRQETSRTRELKQSSRSLNNTSMGSSLSKDAIYFYLEVVYREGY